MSLRAGSLFRVNWFLINMPYYAVRRGRNQGIYMTWDDCREQVNGFPKARYKKFGSEEEAMAFINESDEPRTTYSRPYTQQASFASASYSIPSRPIQYRNPYPQPSTFNSYAQGSRSYPQPSTFNSYAEGSRSYSSNSSNKYGKKPKQAAQTSDAGLSAVVYTDGCCHNNGFHGSVAGIGVYWGENHPRNVSERLTGRQTNNRAEIHAALTAVEQAKQLGVDNLTVYTDSQFLINGVTKWMPTWKTNGWKLADGKPVKNREDFEALNQALNGINVNWAHVRGHTGNRGNEEADRLANEGARKQF